MLTKVTARKKRTRDDLIEVLLVDRIFFLCINKIWNALSMDIELASLELQLRYISDSLLVALLGPRYAGQYTLLADGYYISFNVSINLSQTTLLNAAETGLNLVSSRSSISNDMKSFMLIVFKNVDAKKKHSQILYKKCTTSKLPLEGSTILLQSVFFA